MRGVRTPADPAGFRTNRCVPMMLVQDGMPFLNAIDTKVMNEGVRSHGYSLWRQYKTITLTGVDAFLFDVHLPRYRRAYVHAWQRIPSHPADGFGLRADFAGRCGLHAGRQTDPPGSLLYVPRRIQAGIRAAIGHRGGSSGGRWQWTSHCVRGSGREPDHSGRFSFREFETPTLSIHQQKSSHTDISRSKSKISLLKARFYLGRSHTSPQQSNLPQGIFPCDIPRTLVFPLVPTLLNPCKAKGGEFNIN